MKRGDTIGSVNYTSGSGTPSRVGVSSRPLPDGMVSNSRNPLASGVFSSTTSKVENVGGSVDDQNSYLGVYDFVKDYPQWLALLDANPYKGFQVPESFFDKLGLSNKHKDKFMAYQQSYREYNQQVLQQFLAWQNSLPSTQREQLVAAGYNPDTISPQQSNLSSDAPIINASPDKFASGNSGEELFQAVGAGLQVLSTCYTAGLNTALTVASVKTARSQVEKNEKDVESQGLINYKNAYDIAKSIRKDNPISVDMEAGDDITPSVKQSYPDAPPLVQSILDGFSSSRGFETAENIGEAESINSRTAVGNAVIDNGQLEDLLGKPETWKEMRSLYNEAVKQQTEYARDFYDVLDAMTSATAQNEFNAYSADYFGTVQGVAQGNLMNSYIQSSMLSLQAQKKAIDTKLKAMEIKHKLIDNLFDVATDESRSKFTRGAAQTALFGADILGDYFGVGNIPSTLAPPTSPAANTPLPQLPTR